MDHIVPKTEGGSNASYNLREISAKDNLKKGARMPYLNEVAQSSNPIRCAVDADRITAKGTKHPRNRNRGFGGLSRE